MDILLGRDASYLLLKGLNYGMFTYGIFNNVGIYNYWNV